MRLLHFILFVLVLPLRAQTDSWELPPVSYSETAPNDPLVRLAAKWAEDPSSLAGETPLRRVRGILAALGVPEASQILVFSKTSKQSDLIDPANPRALFFSMDAYCGYVPGGAMEIAIEDPRLGPVFYRIDLGNAPETIRVVRETGECMSCHGTGRTENVPGLQVRSIFPDDRGQPLLALGGFAVNARTPLAERWGGYYVTGATGHPHLGNRTYSEERTPMPAAFAWRELAGKIDVSKYPRATSDIVSLMVLEHQCEAHNLLTAASMNYRRAAYLTKAVDPAADPDQGVARRIADDAARKIVDCFLFTGEAEIGPDGVEGDADFQRQFQAAVPRTTAGDSLADFQLNTRLFKNRCSYMVYSKAFRGLPGTVKNCVLARLKEFLESDPTMGDHEAMKASERRRVLAILKETGVIPPN